MATQGLLTITVNNNVVFKIIAGCNGYNAEDLAEIIKKSETSVFSLQSLWDMAKMAGFGCDHCLVVIDKQSSIPNGEELDKRYRETFNIPEFNPRWDLGTADHVIMVEL